MRTGFRLNGSRVEIEAPPDALLLDVIRDRGLTGSKECCGVGVCGACTMLVDDRPVSSCLFLLACAADSEVWTVEGIARRAPDLVDAFVRAEAMQCGICTPGHVVSAFALCAGRVGPARPSEAELLHHLSGNLCRCTGYQTIIEAVEEFLARS